MFPLGEAGRRGTSGLRRRSTAPSTHGHLMRLLADAPASGDAGLTLAAPRTTNTKSTEGRFGSPRSCSSGPRASRALMITSARGRARSGRRRI